MRIAVRSVAAAVVVLVMTACGAPRDFATYQETIGDFQAAIDQTSTVTFQYIRDINTFEREYEFERLRKDPDRDLDIPDKLLQGKVSPEAIRARAEAFALLKQYTDMLAKLAGSDATERWKVATGRVKSAADALAKTLADNTTTLADLPLAEMTTPLKAIADAVGTEIINMKRSAALDAAIIKAAPQINQISQLLREDVAFVVKQRDSVSLLGLSDLAIEYSKAQDVGNNAERLRVIDKIKQAVSAREIDLGKLEELEHALQRFDQAHDALVEYAKSEKGPEDLSALVSAVREYAGLAKILYDSYRAISQAA